MDFCSKISHRLTDLGRGEVTKNSMIMESSGAPTLRNIRHPAPHMHDGSLATFDEVLKHYNSRKRICLQRQVLHKLGLDEFYLTLFIYIY